MTQSAGYDAGYRDALIVAADLVNRERTAHLIASTRAPAAGPLFRAEQAILARVTPPEASEREARK